MPRSTALLDGALELTASLKNIKAQDFDTQFESNNIYQVTIQVAIYGPSHTMHPMQIAFQCDPLHSLCIYTP